jgi:hypothetical protein
MRSVPLPVASAVPRRSLIENASDSGDITKIAFGYFVGVALMIVGV